MEVDQVAESGEQIDLIRHRDSVPQELNFDSDRLKIFYECVFPCNLFFRWLSYNKLKKRGAGMLTSIEDNDVESEYFHNREFSFTLAGDVYCRYLSFKNANDFKQALVQRVPHKIDIGAVFNMTPSRHLQADKKSFIPMEKEMVFDIDMDSYDDIRQCCSGAKICQKCWTLPCIAAQVIHQILLEDFDFTNCLWVFSGRRGVHCWVCDPDARNMTNEMRAAVASYINIQGLGNEKAERLYLQYPLHPRFQRAYKQLQPYFEQFIINEQNILSNPKHKSKFLEFLPSMQARESCQNKWLNCGGDGKKMWEAWKQVFNETKQLSEQAFKNQNRQLYNMEALVLTYLYPRIDTNVSTSTNHLLKSPFCVHPKTGNVCVPFDPNNFQNFILDQVPTLTQVINQLGSRKQNADNQISEPESVPCLEPYIQIFKKHINQSIQKQERKTNMENNLKSDDNDAIKNSF